MNPMRALGPALLLVLGGVATAQEGRELVREPTARLAQEIAECSGLDRQGDVFWTLSDSGNPPVLYAVGRDGALVRTIDLAPHGAENVDWEDLAVDGEVVYAADFGDNRRVRDVLTIYRVDLSAEAPAVSTIRYRYPDARHDAEALFVRDGALWVVSKAREGYTNVYRLPPSGGDEPVAAVLAGRLAILDLATAADYDPVSRILCVMTYREIHFIADAGGEHPFAAPPSHSIRVLAGQNEALCWDGEDVLFTNEAGEVFRIARPLVEKPASFGPVLPRAAIPRLPAAPLSLPLLDDETGEVRTDAKIEASWDEKGLILAGSFPVDSLVAFDPAESEFGSSLHLLFGRDLSRPLFFRETEELHLFVAFDADLEIRLGRLHHDARTESPLEDVTASHAVEGSLAEGKAEFRVVVPFALLGSTRPAPGTRLLFNCFPLETGSPMLHWSAGMMEYTHEKPYSWGEWELGG